MFHESPIFSQWIADMYDQKETETEDVDFLISLIGETPRKILEVCCGSGRILIPLAKAGHAVSGFDADRFMLAKIGPKAKGCANVHWREADAVHGEWGGGFEVVVLAGNILFNIVSDIEYAAAQETLIRKAAAALLPGGHLYIDYRPGGHLLAHPEGEEMEETGDGGALTIWEGSDGNGNCGRMLLINGTYDKETRLDTFTRRFELTLSNGETVRQDILCQKHFAPLEQMRAWLRGAGFSIEREYGDLLKNPIGEKSTRAILYARKDG